MDVTIAALCDFASVTREGKLNLMGVFGEINPSAMPFVVPQMFLVAAFSASPGEPKNKNLRIVLLTEDGSPLFQADQDVVLPPPSAPGRRVNLQTIYGLGGLRFDSPGNYAFSIQLGGEEKASVPLYVNPPPPGGPTP